MQPVPRLLENIKPISYDLIIDPNMAVFTYQITEKITFETLSPTKALIFHADALVVTNVVLDDVALPVAPTLDVGSQTITFNLDQEIPVGQHRLELVISGEIREGLHGFYRSRYERDGSIKWLATTQFEAIHAREAFVCIDEPSAKAVFNTTIIAPKNSTALSNTHVTAQTIEPDGRTKFVFAPTPLMSTYLVAFIVGELEKKEVVSDSGVTIGVHATYGKSDQLSFALDVTSKILKFYEDYFDISYPLKKLDMVAIPDFGAGAMENWGLITYREVALLIDPDKASRGDIQRVVEVIAHELAHQWFGNLVTMAWWNDLWLNEGFASWIEALAQDVLYPEWQIWTQFIAGDIAQAMELDALVNTHPVEVEVADPKSLDEIFDAISYAKGASIINMMYDYLGHDDFRNGLRHYLKNHAYSNTTTKDLWESLSLASGQEVDKIVGPWISQPGFPIVSIESNEIVQSRFYSSPKELAKASDTPIWPIPMSTLLPSGETSKKLVNLGSEPAGDIALGVKLNPGQAGFYRVKYDLQKIQTLTPMISGKTLPPADRFGIVSDVYAAVGTGLTDSATALAMTAALRDENDYVVWRALLGGYMELFELQPYGELYTQSKQFGRWLMQNSISRLGWDVIENESYFDSLMRPMVLSQAARFDDLGTIAEAKKRFGLYKTDPNSINPDLKGAMLAAVARIGEAAEFSDILELYKHETNPQDKLRLLISLCKFQIPDLAARSLELSMNINLVRPQDCISMIASNLLNRHSAPQTWSFIKQHWVELVNRFGGGGHVLDHIPIYLGMAFSDYETAENIRLFFEQNPHPTITRPVSQAIEMIIKKADWFERDKDNIEKYFSTWNPIAA